MKWFWWIESTHARFFFSWVLLWIHAHVVSINPKENNVNKSFRRKYLSTDEQSVWAYTCGSKGSRDIEFLPYLTRLVRQVTLLVFLIKLNPNNACLDGFFLFLLKLWRVFEQKKRKINRNSRTSAFLDKGGNSLWNALIMHLVECLLSHIVWNKLWLAHVFEFIPKLCHQTLINM